MVEARVELPRQRRIRSSVPPLGRGLIPREPDNETKEAAHMPCHTYMYLALVHKKANHEV